MKRDQILDRLKKMKELLRPCSLNEEMGLTVVREASITIGRLGALITLLESSPENGLLDREICNRLSGRLSVAESAPCDPGAVFELRLGIISALQTIGHFLPDPSETDKTDTEYMSADATAGIEEDLDESTEPASSIDPDKPWPR